MGPSARPWRPLRLLLVTETFPPEVNGVARTLGRWVEAFRGRGHAVAVVRPRQRGQPPAPGQVHGLPLPFYPDLRFGVASPLRLRRLFAAYGPDLVHVATEGPLGLATLLAAARASACRSPAASTPTTTITSPTTASVRWTGC